MKTEIKKDISQFVFVPSRVENVVVTPTFARDAFGKALYETYDEIRESRFDSNPNLKLRYENNEIVGSNIFDVALLDEIVRPYGIRAVVPSDGRDERVLDMVRGEHYTDFKALVLRSAGDSYERNDALAKKLAEHVDVSRLEKEPALIRGFRIEPWAEDAKNYGLQFVPSEDFSIHYDERLLGKYDGWKFNEVDEIGLPEHLDEERGARGWYSKNDGLSRLVLGRNLGLNSDYYGLAYSDYVGRVVFVSGEATSRNFEEEINREYKTQLVELNERREKALEIIRGKK